MAELCGAYPGIYRKPPPTIQSCEGSHVLGVSTIGSSNVQSSSVSRLLGVHIPKKWIQDFNISVIEGLPLLHLE